MGSMDRFEKLRRAVREAGYDAAALVPSATLVYLTGLKFHLSERPIVFIVPAEGPVTAILPKLETPRLTHAGLDQIRVFSYSDEEGYMPGFARACGDLKGKRIAVEGLKMRVLESALLEEYATGSRVVIADEVVSGIRMHKEQSEIEDMRKAIQVSEAALEATLAKVKVGMTERQITGILLNEMTDHGGETLPFDPIVLIGENAGQPHGEPGDRVLHEGDLLLFDYGTTHNGYPADITRTFAVGHLDPELTKVYEVVKAANAAGTKAGRPGVSGQDVDRATRKVIDDAGYGQYFIHRTGHGLGLDGHEGPNMVEGNAQPLEPGNVYTIEPGIYIPGKGGIRIEDNVVVTADGVEVLTSFPRELRILPG